MNNLTQIQKDAKQAYLTRQSENVLAIYQTADNSERSAIIKQIDLFLEIVPKNARSFWLKFRQKLERLNEKMV